MAPGRCSQRAGRLAVGSQVARLWRRGDTRELISASRRRFRDRRRAAALSLAGLSRPRDRCPEPSMNAFTTSARVVARALVAALSLGAGAAGAAEIHVKDAAAT